MSNGTPVREIRSGSRTSGTVHLPPSKSVTNRALNLALLVDGATEIIRPLESEDISAMVAALELLGHAVEETESGLLIEKERSVDRADIDCGASGTMLRFLTASLTTQPGTWVLDGTKRLRERPLGPLISALRDLGARVECLETEGFAPLRIHGGTLRGGAATLDAGASSQFLSALLMASVRATQPVSIRVTQLVSAPYVDITLRAMADFGLGLERSGDGGYSAIYTVAPQKIAGRRIEVEADYSSACYFGAAAALTGGRVTLAGLRARGETAQGDACFFEVLGRMGALCEWVGGDRDNPDHLQISGPGRLAAVIEDFSDMPDQVPTLAMIAPFAAGTTEIAGVGHLRLKESDRLHVVASELSRAGVPGVIEKPDAIVVPGAWADVEPPSDPVTIDTVDDHRVAMSFALLGLRRSGISIAEPDVVAKSYPDFWRRFREICEGSGGSH